VLSEFPQPALPSVCPVCISLASLWLDQRTIDAASGNGASVCVRVSKWKRGQSGNEIIQ